MLSCHRSSKLVPISAFYLGTTNHAASLSSAQLVTPSSQPRQITTATSSTPAAAAGESSVPASVPATVPEEVEAPPVQLEEDVEGPPEEQRELEQRQEATVQEEKPDESDDSTRGVKSEVEVEAPAEEQPRNSEERREEDAPREEEDQLKEKEDAAETTLEEAEQPEDEKPTSGVPQEAVVVESESESAHEVDPKVEQDLAQESAEVEAPPAVNEEGGDGGIETPQSEAQESVDLDDAFEDTEENVEEEDKVDADEEKKDESLVDIEL